MGNNIFDQKILFSFPLSSKDGISSVHYYSSHNHLEPRLYDQESGVSSTQLNNNLKRSESFVEKVKRLLRVDSDDDTDNLHNKVWEWQFLTNFSSLKQNIFSCFRFSFMFVAQIRQLIGILHSLQLCVLNTQVSSIPWNLKRVMSKILIMISGHDVRYFCLKWRSWLSSLSL